MLKNRIYRLREQKPSWLDRRLILLILTLIVFSMAMAWGEPIPQAAAMQANNIQKSGLFNVQPAVQAEVDQTYSPAMLANREQTNGVIIGSVVLILVIIGASISAVHQKAHE